MIFETHKPILRKNKSTPENREFWEFVERTARDVEQNFPQWKRGGYCTENSTLVNEQRRKRNKITIEGKWAHIRQWVEELRRAGWKEKEPVSGEPTGFKFTSVTFEL